jgi:tRNA dimethylallyltransferase
MPAGPAPEYLVVAGPTAVGKTEVALELAATLGGEIVIADSRQVYRGLEIGVAKPTDRERASVPHHLLDVAELGQRYTAAEFARDAAAAIEGIRARGGVPIVCGGTGLYLAALAGALDPIEAGAAPVEREAARARLRAIPEAERFEALGRVDPPTAERLHPRDRQRVDRALEVWFLTGEPLSSWHAGGGARRPHFAVRLQRPRAELVERIDRRLEAMLKAGLESEARALWEAGWTLDDPGLDTIGYQEWWPYFEGRRGREQTVAAIRVATRHYAKRQATWFRNQGTYTPLPADGATARIAELWRAA